MNKKLLVFGGTYEARQLSMALSRAGQEAEVCTATRYGAELVADLAHITVRQGRLDAKAMRRLIATGRYRVVLDATHPYAMEATCNIRAACDSGQVAYIRIVREEIDGFSGSGIGDVSTPPCHHALPDPAGVRQPPEQPKERAGRVYCVPDMPAAIRLLAQMPGRVLLTTGSKNLQDFCTLLGFAERLFVRVLPLPDILEQCLALGYDTGHIVAMRGPFSREMNAAMLRNFGCTVLVTKNSGKAGGFSEKLQAARDTGATVIVIDRPERESGVSWEQALRNLGLKV